MMGRQLGARARKLAGKYTFSAVNWVSWGLTIYTIEYIYIYYRETLSASVLDASIYRVLGKVDWNTLILKVIEVNVRHKWQQGPKLYGRKCPVLPWVPLVFAWGVQETLTIAHSLSWTGLRNAVQEHRRAERSTLHGWSVFRHLTGSFPGGLVGEDDQGDNGTGLPWPMTEKASQCYGKLELTKHFICSRFVFGELDVCNAKLFRYPLDLSGALWCILLHGDLVSPQNS